MRYLAALLLLSSCAAQAEDKPKAADDFSVFRVDLDVIKTNTEFANAKLEEIDSKLDALLAAPQAVPQVSAALPSVETVTAPSPKVAEPVPITFQGKPIDLAVWLKTPAPLVEIAGDVDKHLNDHGIEGDLSGLTRDQKIRIHSVAHTKGVPLKSAKVAAKPAVVLPQSSNCLNGNCNRQQYGYQTRQRLFGRAWR